MIYDYESMMDCVLTYTLYIGVRFHHSHKSTNMRYDYITIFGKFFFYPSSIGTVRVSDLRTFSDIGGWYVCDNYSEAVCFAEAQY